MAAEHESADVWRRVYLFPSTAAIKNELEEDGESSLLMQRIRECCDQQALVVRSFHELEESYRIKPIRARAAVQDLVVLVYDCSTISGKKTSVMRSILLSDMANAFKKVPFYQCAVLLANVDSDKDVKFAKKCQKHEDLLQMVLWVGYADREGQLSRQAKRGFGWKTLFVSLYCFDTIDPAPLIAKHAAQMGYYRREISNANDYPTMPYNLAVMLRDNYAARDMVQLNEFDQGRIILGYVVAGSLQVLLHSSFARAWLVLDVVFPNLCVFVQCASVEEHGQLRKILHDEFHANPDMVPICQGLLQANLFTRYAKSKRPLLPQIFREWWNKQSDETILAAAAAWPSEQENMTLIERQTILSILHQKEAPAGVAEDEEKTDSEADAD